MPKNNFTTVKIDFYIYTKIAYECLGRSESILKNEQCTFADKGNPKLLLCEIAFMENDVSFQTD